MAAALWEALRGQGNSGFRLHVQKAKAKTNAKEREEQTQRNAKANRAKWDETR